MTALFNETIIDVETCGGCLWLYEKLIILVYTPIIIGVVG